MLFEDDIIRMYADSRKDISEKEVKEVFDSMISYLKKRVKSDDCYAIDLPNLGILYKEKSTTDPFFYLESLLNSSSPINKTDIVKHNYGDATKEEIQEISNSYSLKT